MDRRLQITRKLFDVKEDNGTPHMADARPSVFSVTCSHVTCSHGTVGELSLLLDEAGGGGTVGKLCLLLDEAGGGGCAVATGVSTATTESSCTSSMSAKWKRKGKQRKGMFLWRRSHFRVAVVIIKLTFLRCWRY